VHQRTYGADDDLPGDLRRREVRDGGCRGRPIDGSDADRGSPLADGAG
jgi:hypothetical protein